MFEAVSPHSLLVPCSFALKLSTIYRLENVETDVDQVKNRIMRRDESAQAMRETCIDIRSFSNASFPRATLVVPYFGRKLVKIAGGRVPKAV